MTIDDQIRDEKLQYDINREVAKISALSSGKIHKYEYITGEDVIPSNKQQIVEQVKFSYSPLGKAFEKQTKIIEDQVNALNTFKSDNKLTIEDIIPKSALINDESKKELDKIEKIEKSIDREKLVYNASDYTYDFRNFRTIRTFGRDIYEGKISLEEADDDLSNLIDETKIFKQKTRPQNNNKKQEKEIVLENLHKFYNAREMVLYGFKSKIFSIKSKGSGLLNSKLKILTPKQMLKRLPIALAQIKVGNNSENLLNKIREIVYSLYQSKEITKKLYNNIINSL